MRRPLWECARVGDANRLYPNNLAVTKPIKRVLDAVGEPGGMFSLRRLLARALMATALPAVLVLAGCGGQIVGGASNGSLLLSPGTAVIDTNCAGCNATSASGIVVEQFSASFGSGAAQVNWSVAGGDAISGPGTINAIGQYTPPSYLTADAVQVTVTASLAENSSMKASTNLRVRPGFLQPLTPENAALGAGGTTSITSYVAEAGGTVGVSFSLAGASTGSGAGAGSLGSTSCTRSSIAFTYCTVEYTAPASLPATASTYVIASIGSSSAKQSAEILLNTQGISSDPEDHEKELATPVLLGSSGGNNYDYDTRGNQIVDCCAGTLGSLIQNSSGTQYLLSCNHVLARSDQASVGEMIVQPGLIDNNCTPNGYGSGTTPVGVLTAWLPLSSSSTNVDAAIAQVDSNAVNASGAILELGAQQPNGALAAAPPGVSSTGGKGEWGSLNLTVAKSGRTTGLTCANISALDLDVEVDYFKNCGETIPYLTKIYTNQIAVEGNQFSDAGDSGSLVVDVGNAEPVGLFFAGGVTNTGVSEGVANPAPSVLAELGQQEGTNYSFVGTTDHAVSCLNYGAATATTGASSAQASALELGQAERAQQAAVQARLMINPTLGILSVTTGKSSDRAGEAAVIFYVDQGMNVTVPQTVNGVRTEVIPATAQSVASGTAPGSAVGFAATFALPSAVFKAAVAAKEQVAQSLMQQNPAFFGVGVGQSLDNPREAALVIYVDQNQVPAILTPVINGLRTRYVIMNRLHVTRSYLEGPVRSMGHCMAHGPSHRSNFSGAITLRRELH
ncbi:MAG: hypothetical protein WBP85_04695 [Terracidiphilus sp.]